MKIRTMTMQGDEGRTAEFHRFIAEDGVSILRIVLVNPKIEGCLKLSKRMFGGPDVMSMANDACAFLSDSHQPFPRLGSIPNGIHSFCLDILKRGKWQGCAEVATLVDPAAACKPMISRQQDPDAAAGEMLQSVYVSENELHSVPGSMVADREKIAAAARRILEQGAADAEAVAYDHVRGIIRAPGFPAWHYLVDSPGDIREPVTMDAEGVFHDADGRTIVFTLVHDNSDTPDSPISAEDAAEMDQATQEALEGNDLLPDDAEPVPALEPCLDCGGEMTMSMAGPEGRKYWVLRCESCGKMHDQPDYWSEAECVDIYNNVYRGRKQETAEAVPDGHRILLQLPYPHNHVTVTLPPLLEGQKLKLVSGAAGTVATYESEPSPIAEVPEVEIEPCLKCGGFMKIDALGDSEDEGVAYTLYCDKCDYRSPYVPGMSLADCVHDYNRTAVHYHSKLNVAAEILSGEALKEFTEKVNAAHFYRGKPAPAAKPETKLSREDVEKALREAEAEVDMLFGSEKIGAADGVKKTPLSEHVFDCENHSRLAGAVFNRGQSAGAGLPGGAKPKMVRPAFLSWRDIIARERRAHGARVTADSKPSTPHKMLIVGTPGEIEPCFDCGGNMAFGMRDLAGNAIHCISCQACPLEIDYPVDTPMSICVEHYNNTAKCKRGETPPAHDQWPNPIRRDPKPCDGCGLNEFIIPFPVIGMGMESGDDVLHVIRCKKCGLTHTESISYDWATPYLLSPDPSAPVVRFSERRAFFGILLAVGAVILMAGGGLAWVLLHMVGQLKGSV